MGPSRRSNSGNDPKVTPNTIRAAPSITHRPESSTAVGRPLPDYKEPSVWEKACPWGLQAPIPPPFHFTNDSIIPVIVRLWEPATEDKKKRRSRQPSIAIARFINWLTGIRGSKDSTVCVRMPRREYLKHFAHDENGRYIGTEKQRNWTKKDLDLEFGAYQNPTPQRWVRSEERGRVFMSEDRDHK